MSSTQEPEAPAPARNPEAQAPSDTATTNPELDLPKLQSLPAEQQDLFLLTYVSSLTKHVLDLAADDCTAQQFYLKKEIFQIINLSSPQPSRVIRNNLGKCLAHIFGIGDRKLLFETINDLIAIISSGKSKSDAEIRTKHAAIVCLGDVFASAGDSAIGLHPLACSTLLKLLKSSSNNAGIRAACLTALGKIVGMVEGSMDEVIGRDIWKQGRNHASSDKGHLVVASACRTLKTLFRHTPYFLYSSDLDKLETAISKAFDSPSVQVRQAAAECFAEALFQGHSEGGPPEVASPKGKKTKKALKPSPAPSGKRSQVLALSLTDILKNLASQYVKSTASNRIRAAIGVCYACETNYLKIVESLAIDVLGHSTIANNRYRLLISRNIVDVVIQDVIGRKILGESGQISAAKSLINNVFKNYPQALAERPEPSKHTLIATLSAVSSLIQSLGSAANTFAESCRDGLLQVLQHSSYTVQVFASHCMKTLVLACPQQLLPCLSVCMNSLNRELSLLGSGRNSPRRCIGFAHGLAATLSASPARPLYGSVEINSRVLTIATNMLKSSSQAQLRVASTQIQVAWVLIGGLMSLGPNFVKIHLSQLLLLWKNALPKPLAKDNTSARSFLEVSFLTHVRECAMGSILAFLEFNSRLLTVDVSKRIAAMLQNTTAFLRTLPSKKTSDDVSQRLAPALQLQDLEMMVQRRVLQCYVKLVNLSPAGGSEALLQSNLLTLAISLFADPENYAPNSLSASIANAAATFESVWDVSDNSGFGITGLVAGPRVRKLPGQQENSDDGNTDELESPEDMINNLLRSPICGSLEHDASVLYIGSTDSASSPDPPATEVINAAIQLFAFAFPLTPGKVQESILEQIRTFASAGTLIRDPGRKAAINVNLAVAILTTMRVAVKETKSPSDIVRDFVLDPDEHVRSLGYAATARLCNINARAGCAMALGSIQTQTILGILMSLCNDPHPVVHFWALEALSLASDASGLSFAGYVPSTLGMLVQLYVSETHHAEISSAITMNLELELSTTSAIARCVDSLINSRELIFTLVNRFREEDDLLHLSLYAPGHMQFADYVKLLQKYLMSESTTLRDVSVDGIHNMMKRNPQDVLREAETGFEEQLWLVLDTVPSHDGIRNIIRNWMHHTCLTETNAWLQRFQATEDTQSGSKGSGLPDLQDEEVAGFAAAAGAAKDEKETKATSEVEPLRWQMFLIIAKDVTANGESKAQSDLQGKVADVVRMAFSASTSSIIGDILKMFGKTPDPDFEEAMLLEQYQAQISSALTPAFAADSSPELASEAVNVCASFISIGIVTDVDRMENFSKDSENAAIGDLKSLSSNAQVMVKISVSEQKYLLDVLRPHIGTLTPLWLESLREFARLRFEPDISMTLGPPSLSGSLDTIYAALNRETLLRFYQDAWLKLDNGPSASGKSKNSDINYRDEPVAFFFVLFGLAFEALATRSGQSDSLATHEQTLAILQALKKILHPSVSGHAIYRPMLLTESLDVQGVIVEIASVLCIAHPSARRHATEEGDLSDDIDQLFELTRIIVLVLTGLLPNLSEGNQPARHQMNEEAILLVRSSLNALVDAAEVFPAIIKTDLHACIIHIFATILSTPGCQELIVPQSLSTLKRFVGSMSKSRRNHSNGEPSSTDIQLQGCLRRFLSIYLNAQKREAPQSLTCVKNCLLATTILFTGGQNHLPASEALVARYLEELMDCLTDRMTAKIAANCIKSLLLQPSQTSADLSIARYLFPRLVAFVTDTDPEDPENARSLIAQTLCQYVGTGVRGRHLAAMAVVIPTLMARATAEGEEVYQETSARLLELAAIDQEMFRAVVGGMSDGQKGFLEEVIRFGRQNTGHVSKAATGESGQTKVGDEVETS
ncbi:armadillo-type protein [Fusarium oxysporum]|nr:armadillo-type protein [Fusarium oxysporum]